jgi:hypothetical protein
MIAMILTILVSMLVYIFWFIKSEFQRVLDRIDQSTLGIARMQRELTQSTVQQLNDQLHESFGRLEEEYDGEKEDEESEEGEDEESEEGEEGEDQVVKDAPLEEIDESDEVEETTTVEETPDIQTVEKEIATAIEELDAVITESPPKKRGRKPNK